MANAQSKLPGDREYYYRTRIAQLQDEIRILESKHGRRTALEQQRIQNLRQQLKNAISKKGK